VIGVGSRGYNICSTTRWMATVGEVVAVKVQIKKCGR
jgi:hypothetical protein